MLSTLVLTQGYDILVGTGANKIYYLKDAGGSYKVINEFQSGDAPSWIQLSHNKNFLFATNEGSQGIQSF
jgi:6-phosphogluconolactonase (cycloisomerase 2 family)